MPGPAAMSPAAAAAAAASPGHTGAPRAAARREGCAVGPARGGGGAGSQEEGTGSERRRRGVVPERAGTGPAEGPREAVLRSWFYLGGSGGWSTDPGRAGSDVGRRGGLAEAGCRRTVWKLYSRSAQLSISSHLLGAGAHLSRSLQHLPYLFLCWLLRHWHMKRVYIS